MKLLPLIFLLAATSLLTGCADLWLYTYRLKGGYYDRPSQPLKAPKTHRP
jgi:hypothetical protein